ncbi:pyruvate kinase [Mycoplasmopsis phocirhinis]|uniref:Pyruvate kinase n=1 Tax=Mycoplasmopsis phocirhinis TaxID=142650 RepID=A0A4P6MRV4_9BACT|nr:pyruvate kinase [Mycoplasmopsis phocirhinis]QBF34561.1 pyruvate kinase [Mycoplasmopsis phocirhinis]
MKLDNHKEKLTITVGPSITTLEMMKNVIKAGATVIRANFSHGSIEEQRIKFDLARQAAHDLGVNISLLLDTKGPEIRVGKIKNGAVLIEQNQELKIISTPQAYQNLEGNQNQVSVAYDMSVDLKVGDKVLFDDGKLSSNVTQINPGEIIVKTLNSHILKTNKRINLPNVDFSLPFLSDKDINDIKFGIEYGVDFIAASFVNSAKNVNELRELLNNNGGEQIQIISKIESQIAINNIDEIIEASDGIMIARGDLGLEIPYYEVPYWQQQIIDKCRQIGKIVIVATQMLDSLENNPQPTRAEVSDVYWATSYGADSTMLSNETAAGKYPVRAVEVMRTINQQAENDYYASSFYTNWVNYLLNKLDMDNEQNILISKIVKAVQNGDYKYTFVVTKNPILLNKLSQFRLNTVFIGILPNDKMQYGFGATSGVKIVFNSAKWYKQIINDETKISELEQMVEFQKDDKYALVLENELKYKKFSKY